MHVWIDEMGEWMHACMDGRVNSLLGFRWERRGQERLVGIHTLYRLFSRQKVWIHDEMGKRYDKDEMVQSVRWKWRGSAVSCEL